jgi:hypothetical protein
MAEMGRMLSVVDGERVVVETFEVPTWPRWAGCCRSSTESASS